jgi:hypothetical protein
VTFAAQNRASDFRLKRNVVVLAAVIADDFKFFRRIAAAGSFFRAAFDAPLRRHHIALIKIFLLFFRENKNVFALHTRNFNIRHCFFSSSKMFTVGASIESLSQSRRKSATTRLAA